ncbi:hypothetical protein ACMXYR_07105 [Neptuniibacter sp. QD29_5]|uniref:hypothetical protein n=1 Tax=Neptuniibacter sp. QD29_5 TaxID=3398207 RepID=UPI0039F467B6
MSFAVRRIFISFGLIMMVNMSGCTNLLLGKSYVNFHAERHKKVVIEIAAKLQKGTLDSDSYIERGWAYFCLKEYEKALSDFSYAIELDSSNPFAYIGRGNSRRALDFQSPPDGIISHPHKEHGIDLNTANILAPELLAQEINKYFGYLSNNNFIFPVSGYCFPKNSLVLGSAEILQVMEKLPPVAYKNAFGAIPVYKPTKPQIGKVGQVVQRAKSKYSVEIVLPYSIGNRKTLLLVFDKNDKLIVIRLLDTMFLNGKNTMIDYSGNERLKKIGRGRFNKYKSLVQKYPFKEIYRETFLYEYKTLRADVTPCITIDISVPVEPELGIVTYIIEYIYTCLTK